MSNGSFEIRMAFCVVLLALLSPLMAVIVLIGVPVSLALESLQLLRRRRAAPSNASH